MIGSLKKKDSVVADKRAKLSNYDLSQVLIAPIVSEKSTMISEKNNQILFKVLRRATKADIKAAVELMFKVNVVKVSTLVQKGKAKRFGKSTGRRDHIKKAYISLSAGSEIDFSQGAM